MPWKTKSVHCGPCWGTGSTQKTEYYTDHGGMSQCRTVSAICYSCGGSGRKSERVWEADYSTDKPNRRASKRKPARQKIQKKRQKQPFYQVADPEQLKKNRSLHNAALRRYSACLVAFLVSVMFLSSDSSVVSAVMGGAIAGTITWLILATLLRPVIAVFGTTLFYICRFCGAA